LDAGKVEISDESAEFIIAFFLSKENFTSAGIAVKNSPVTGLVRWMAVRDGGKQ